MIQSNELNELAKALAAAQGEMTPAVKNRINPHFKSSYADLDSCWAAAKGPLTKHGLSVVQGLKTEGKKVTVTTKLLHSSGQWIESELSLEARGGDPQSVGGAITYGRRYGFSAAIGLTTDEDDDGNHSSPPPKQPPKQPQRQPEPPVDIPFKGLPACPDHLRGQAYEGTEAQKAYLKEVFAVCGLGPKDMELIQRGMAKLSGDDMGTIAVSFQNFVTKERS